MLTPQDVSGRSFTKAVMGGYNMAMVDEFLDEVTADYTALYQENATLKAKLKILVEKVEEYRATEDSMRATLLTAQRMADTIVQEAETKRDEILSQAESTARERLEVYRREAAVCDERVRQGRQELRAFIAASRELCNRELAFLEQLPEITLEEEEEESADAMAEEIEETVRSAVAEELPQTETTPAPAPEQPAPQAEVPQPQQTPKAEETPAPGPAQPAALTDETDLQATRRINLVDLKFGRNYSGETG